MKYLFVLILLIISFFCFSQQSHAQIMSDTVKLDHNIYIPDSTNQLAKVSPDTLFVIVDSEIAKNILSLVDIISSRIPENLMTVISSEKNESGFFDWFMIILGGLCTFITTIFAVLIGIQTLNKIDFFDNYRWILIPTLVIVPIGIFILFILSLIANLIYLFLFSFFMILVVILLGVIAFSSFVIAIHIFTY